jgi:hypothetical protein
MIRLLSLVLVSSLLGCAEAPYVYYKYSGTVKDGSGNVLTGVSVAATSTTDLSTALVANRSDNVTSATTSSTGDYSVQLGFRGSWNGKLVFKKAGFSTNAVDIASDSLSHKEDEVVAATKDVVLTA